MVMEIARSLVGKAAARMPGLLLRRIWSPETLLQDVQVCLRRDSPGEISAGSSIPRLTLWFTVVNLSNLPIRFEGMSINVWTNGQLVATGLLDGVRTIEPRSDRHTLHYVALLSEYQVAYLRSQAGDAGRLRTMQVTGTAGFSSTLGRFSRELDIEARDFSCVLRAP